MDLKRSNKYLLASILIISGFWLLLALVQKTSPPAPPSLSAEMLQPLNPRLDSEVLKIIKKHRGL